jgi:hypothetical protein
MLLSLFAIRYSLSAIRHSPLAIADPTSATIPSAVRLGYCRSAQDFASRNVSQAEAFA